MIRKKNGTIKKMVLIICFVGVTCITLSGCHFQHKWIEATCTEPKTCSVGGETEGEPLGHDWVEATCKEPKTCSRCGETEGEPLEHKPGKWEQGEEWTEEVKKCTVCGEVIKSRKISSTGTVLGFCQRYNETLLKVVASNGESSQSFGASDYQKYKLVYNDMNDEGAIPVGDAMSIEINPTGKREPKNKMEIANFIIKDISSVNTDELVPIFLSYLMAVNDKFTTDQCGNLYEYLVMTKDTPPEIDGYEFVRYGAGKVLLFQTKIS